MGRAGLILEIFSLMWSNHRCCELVECPRDVLATGSCCSFVFYLPSPVYHITANQQRKNMHQHAHFRNSWAWHSPWNIRALLGSLPPITSKLVESQVCDTLPFLAALRYFGEIIELITRDINLVSYLLIELRKPPALSNVPYRKTWLHSRQHVFQKMP